MHWKQARTSPIYNRERNTKEASVRTAQHQIAHFANSNKTAADSADTTERDHGTIFTARHFLQAKSRQARVAGTSIEHKPQALAFNHDRQQAAAFSAHTLNGILRRKSLRQFEHNTATLGVESQAARGN
ncbi:MAG: hypothetical protein ACJAYX_000811, partial [Planctomycetota bacterium]